MKLDRNPLVGITALLFSAAIVASLFFHGYKIEFFVLAQVILLVVLALVLWMSHDLGIVIPRTFLMGAVLLFWLWMGLSLLWTQAPAVGALNFWWMSSFPLGVLIYSVSPRQEPLWRYSRLFFLLIGLSLAIMAVFQLFVLHTSPRSVFIYINSHAALLILLILPLISYLLASLEQKPGYGLRTSLLGAGLFILTYAVAITGGRGPILALLLGMAVLLALNARHVAKRHLSVVVLIIGLAFILGNFGGQGTLVDRLATLESPTVAGNTRLMIWERAWQMIKEIPWWGLGPGVFALAYPAYRHPGDTSLGNYVHNDYLQIWIELGLPGLGLFLAIWIGLFFMFLRAWPKAGDAAAKMEMSGLFCGLFTIAAHSVIDFDFYHMSILLIAGAMLGRLQMLILQQQGGKTWQWFPSRMIGAPAYRLLICLLPLFPMIYFAATALATREYQQALSFAERGEMEQADAAFHRATRLAPSGDSVAMSHADLYRYALTLSGLPAEQRAAVFAQAQKLLARAERLNPYRAQIFLIRAQLYQQNPNLMGKEWATETARAYERALTLNPRFYHGRYLYADFLRRQGRIDTARAVLEAGLDQWYVEDENIVPYYTLAAALRAQAGNKEGAAQLQKKARHILQRARQSGTPAL